MFVLLGKDESGEFVPVFEDKTFGTKKAAAQFAIEQEISPFKVILDTTEVIDWQGRELNRITTGHYKPVCLANKCFYLNSIYANQHFLHLSKDGTKVAFTESPEKGIQDIQTVMTPGRYLAKYFPSLHPEVLDSYVADFVRVHGQYELKIQKDGTEIANDYRRVKLGSCMSYSGDNYNSSVHPCTVYGAGDIECATAWLDDKMVARCLIWRREGQETLVSRIYGDVAPMQSALATIGIETKSDKSTYDSLEGARLLRVEDSTNRFVIPYIDSCQYVRDTGDYLIIDDSGDIDSQCSHSTGGLSGHAHVCDRCEDGVDEDNLNSVRTAYGLEQWCDHCFDNHSFYCEKTEEYYSDTDFESIMVITYGGHHETWCVEETEYSYFYCEETGEYYDSRHYTEIEVSKINKTITVCLEVAEDIYYCEYSATHVHSDDTIILADGGICSAEYFEDEGFTCHSNGENYLTDYYEAIKDKEGNIWEKSNAMADLCFIAKDWTDLPDHENSPLKMV